MYLLNEIINIIEKNKTKKIAIFVDMDGVVADYRFGEGNNIKSNVPGTYSNKRPIETTINNLKQIHEKTHCEMFILSRINLSVRIVIENQKPNFLYVSLMMRIT